MKKWLLLPLIGFTICGWIKFCGTIINTSPSMPIGIYLKKSASIKRGDIVAVCLAPPYIQLGLQRHYLKPGFGCTHTRPLIKQVIAIPGDQVTLTDDYLSVNGKFYFYRTFYQDHYGHSLPVFPRGAYAAGNFYWLLGVHDPHSWDSRYWGPVSPSQIISSLHPLITLK